MALNKPLATRLSLSQLMFVIVCLGAFACLPVLQLTLLTLAESSETECPLEEDGEGCEEELVVTASARRRLNSKRPDASRSHWDSSQACQAAHHGSLPRAVVVHQLPTGLRAPLVI
jgi:hypothetical protein